MSSLWSLSWLSRSYILPLLLLLISILVICSILSLTRLLVILFRPKPTSLTPLRPPTSSNCPTHVLIVLGSGGHTAEMLNMLRYLPLYPSKFTHRTYVISSGDGFSARKANEFETEISDLDAHSPRAIPGQTFGSYDIVSVRRARRVHQSLISTPWSAALCLWDCIRLLTGAHPRQDQGTRQLPVEVHNRLRHPDLIITNGPGTGVCVVLASLILLFFGFAGPPPRFNTQFKDDSDDLRYWRHSGQMRTIFVESWARVKTLSLSGKILIPFVDRFLVQWPSLEGVGGGKAELVGTVVA